MLTHENVNRRSFLTQFQTCDDCCFNANVVGLLIFSLDDEIMDHDLEKIQRKITG